MFWYWTGDSLSSEAEDGDWWYKRTVKESGETVMDLIPGINPNKSVLPAQSSSFVAFQGGGQRIQLIGSTNFTANVYLTGVRTGWDRTEARYPLTAFQTEIS
jgi:hypothetical protein